MTSVLIPSHTPESSHPSESIQSIGSAAQPPGVIESTAPSTPQAQTTSKGSRPHIKSEAPASMPPTDGTNITESVDVPLTAPWGEPFVVSSVMQTTDWGLKPIPPAATQVGDPNGHHEITAPDFTATRPCGGCQPVIEVTATGWFNDPEEQMGNTHKAPQVTVPAGSGSIVVSQAPNGGDFVIDGSTLVVPGQTVTKDNTPIVVQTSAGRVEVVVGTKTVQIPTNQGSPMITNAPVLLPPVLTIGTKTIMPDDQTRYIIDDQTLAPGGPALTVDGSTLSLAPSATALVINGESSAIVPQLGNIYTTQMPGALTFKNNVYTTNRAGYIVLGPGTTLIPGGSPVTVDGTILSFEHEGTAVVVQGTTSQLQPVTTVVTLTRGIGGIGGGMAGETPGRRPQYPERPDSGGVTLRHSYAATDGWFGGLLLLSWWGFGVLAARL